MQTFPRHEIRLPWPPAVLNPNHRAHHRVRSKAKAYYRDLCYLSALPQLPREVALPGSGWDLWVTFFEPNARERDRDNLLAAIKSGLDGLAEAIEHDDKWFRRVVIDERHESPEKGRGFVRVTLIPRDPFTSGIARKP